MAQRAARQSGAAVAKPVSRVERKEATRQQIIASTIDAIADGGLADLTLSKITSMASVSRGLVNFHFESKEQLLVETLKYLTEEYAFAWRKAVERAGPTPAQRLSVIVNNDFHPSICNRRKVAVWFAFRGESKSRPTYLEVCNRADEEFVRMIVGVLDELKTEGGYGFEPARVANGLGALVEGLWLDCLMYTQEFKREDAVATVMMFLEALMPRHFPGAATPAS